MFFNFLLVPGQVAHQPSRKTAVELGNLLGTSRRRRCVQLPTPPLVSFLEAPIIGFIHTVELSGITLTLASVPVIAVDANVMLERECKMLPGTLCRARPAATLAHW